MPAPNHPKTLFYVVDWLPPDFGAVGQYALLFAREIARQGVNVVVIGLTTGDRTTTSEPLADSGSLEIKRLPAKKYNKTGLLSRSIWSLRTNFKLILEVMRDPRSRNADVLFTGSPPFMLFFAIFTKWLRGARLTYRITDFYPEVLVAALGRKPFPLVAFERATWFLRRRIDKFEVLGEDQRRLLIAGGIAPDKIVLKRDVPPITFSPLTTPSRPPTEIAGRKILLYSGNYGIAHEVDTIIGGLREHYRDGNGRFGLWLNASGSAIPQVAQSLRAAKIPFAQSLPVPLEQLPGLLISPDAHLITLRPQFAGYVLPSKIYGCLQSGRPIIFVGPQSSDVHLLCTEQHGLIYERVEPGDCEGFARALDRIAQRDSVQ